MVRRVSVPSGIQVSSHGPASSVRLLHKGALEYKNRKEKGEKEAPRTGAEQPKLAVVRKPKSRPKKTTAAKKGEKRAAKG